MKYFFIYFIILSFLLLMNITVGFALEHGDLKEAIAITKPGVVIVASITAVATEFEDGSQEIIPVGSMGTGFTVSSDSASAYIVTCAHIITLGGQVSPDQVLVVVGLNQGKTLYKAQKIVTCNSEEDIAILRISSPNIPTLRLNESSKNVEQGESVVAMGFPTETEIGGYSIEMSATPGIISAIRRSQIGPQLIQTNAAINPGNSGGPLIDASGEVIGIVNAKAAGGEGIAYAIPVNLIRAIMRESNVTNEPGEVDILFMNGVKAFRDAERTWLFKNSKYNQAKEYFKEVQQKCDYHQGAEYYLNLINRIHKPTPWPLRPEAIIFLSVGIFFVFLAVVAALMLSKPKAVCPYCGRTVDRSWGDCPYCAQQRLGRELSSYSLSGDEIRETTVKPQEKVSGFFKTIRDRVTQTFLKSGSARATLLVKNGDKQGLTYEVSKPEVLIGRDEKCDIVLNDGKVSAQHAKIIRREGRFVIIDGPSRNGTSLNGVKISSSNLQDGDELKMGDTTLVFREIRL